MMRLQTEENRLLAFLLRRLLVQVTERHGAACTRVGADALPCVTDITAAFFGQVADLVVDVSEAVDGGN